MTLTRVTNALTKTFVSPRRFGAVGDGVTDDNAAVQAWQDYMVANKDDQEIVGWLDGTFQITQLVDLTTCLRPVYGNGLQTSGFIQATDNVGILKIGGDVSDKGLRHGNYELRYVNEQSASNTSAIALEAQYLAYSVLDGINIFGAYRGFYSPDTPSDNYCFSNNIRNFKINRCSDRYFSIAAGTGTGNTGNVIENIYMSGQRADVAGATCDLAFHIERMSDGVINQINVEWMTCNRAISVNRCSPTFNGVHFEGVAARTAGNGLIYILGSLATINGLRLKTVNFSGGDPETKATGAIGSQAVIQVEDVASYNGGKVIVTGSNENCTAATSNTYFAKSNGGWDNSQLVECVAWDDEDGTMVQDADGEPAVLFSAAPNGAYMPVLTRYNNVKPFPFARVRDSAGQGGAGIVDWGGTDENLFNAFNGTANVFEAAERGLYLIDGILQIANWTEVRQANPTSIVNSTYRWTASVSGTNEYYLKLAAGGNPSISSPTHLSADGAFLSTATLGSLTAGTWNYGDNDTLGFSTVYVRLTDGTDPDSKDDGFVKAYIEATAKRRRFEDNTGGYSQFHVQMNMEKNAVAWVYANAATTPNANAECTFARLS